MTVAFYTLGCKVNLYETTSVLNMFKNKGYEIVNFSDKADIYIINTCTVTNMSDIKSRKIIRQAVKKNKEAIIVVMGCYSQIKEEEVKKIDGVNIIVGTNNKTKVVELVEAYIKNRENVDNIKDIHDIAFEDMSVTYFEGKTRAFVKIQDGCNNYCSYCIIPYARGNVRSKKKEDVIKEITNLVHNGYIEVVLTGIHTGHYGSDFEHYDFADLLSDISKIDGLKRIRISSIEIKELNDKVLKLLSNNIIANHLHIPLQSGSNTILTSMNRRYDTEYFENKIKDIRNIRSDIAITTDVIVGFPGESEKEFNETYNFIKKIKFSALHVFPYSKREGTKAASMPNQIDNSIKKERVEKLIKLSKELELEYMQQFVNKKVEIIPETFDNEYLIGHSSNYLKIKIKGDEKLIGQLLTVTIKAINYPYCIGERE